MVEEVEGSEEVKETEEVSIWDVVLSVDDVTEVGVSVVDVSVGV